MDEQRQRRNRAVGTITAALKKIPGARHYAVSDGVLIALGALREVALPPEATQEQVIELLQSLREFVPSLFQERPSEPTSPIDLSAWKNEAGEIPPNPFSKATLNVSEQNWLRKNQPALADYLKRQAEGGDTFSGIARQKETEARNKALREMLYGEKEHAENIFRRSNNMTERDAFRKLHGDAVTDFFQREANEEVRLPWTGTPNLTLQGKIASKDPALQELIRKSIPVAQAWARDDLFEAEKQVNEATARAKAAREVLNQKLEAEREERNRRIDALLQSRS
jgi:hypothetical protein